MIATRLILLPSDPEFHQILNGTLPLDFDGSQCVVQRSGSGLLETVSFEDAIEYAYGGEYDEVDDDFDEEEG
jgi:hypothetical protein